MKFLLVIQTKPASASREVCFGNPKMGLRSITSGQPTGITRPIPCPLRQTVDIAWTNGSCLQYSLTMVVLKFHAMSIVCIHGSQVCYGWAPDGPQAMGPFLGLPKAGRKLDMCQIFVQNLSKQGIMIHFHFGWKMVHGQNVDSIWISVGPEIIHVLSTCRVTRW